MKETFEYRKATIEDIEILTSTRIEVLKAANKLPESTDMFLIEKESSKYYKAAFQKDEHVAYLVFFKDKFAGCGGISFYQVMPTFNNPNGKKAYIMNMYTRPQFRRNGIAIKTLDFLIEEAKKRNIVQISLEATELGQPLYEKYGFILMNHEMELK